MNTKQNGQFIKAQIEILSLDLQDVIVTSIKLPFEGEEDEF